MSTNSCALDTISVDGFKVGRDRLKVRTNDFTEPIAEKPTFWDSPCLLLRNIVSLFLLSSTIPIAIYLSMDVLPSGTSQYSILNSTESALHTIYVAIR